MKRSISTQYYLCFLLAFLGPFQVGMAGPYSALVMDVESERVLYSRNAEELRHPASLTKMMTLYMVFDALAKREISLQDKFRTSAYAASRAPSKMGLRTGEYLTVEEGILGLVTQSANDAATVLAEGLGGSESNFTYLMTRKARDLGMNSTIFHNASGLPDPTQVTTAYDMFRLGKALLKHFPQYYSYFSTERFDFRNRSFHNHNHLLSNYPGTDGIKTGFVNSSGFNLVASARREGHRLIGVVFGGPTHSRRDAHMRAILDDGFAQLEGREPSSVIAGFEPADTPVLLRRPESVDPRSLRSLKTKMQTLAKAEFKTQPQGDIGDRIGSKDKKRQSWQIRLGEFSKGDAAEQRLSQALRAAPFPLRHAKVAITSTVHKGKKAYVALFRGVSKDEAQQACQTLRVKGLGCAPMLASR